jgi:spore germination protein (amino acid permease)
MGSVNRMSFSQVCMILMLMNGLASHVVVNPMILDASGRDAWVSVIMAAVFYVPWSLLLVLFMKRSGNRKLQPWLADRTKPWISWVLMAPICLYLYLIGGLTLLHTSTWTITNYLPATPKLVLVTVLALVCLYMAKTGMRSMAIGAGVLLPIVVFLGIFVSVANTAHKNYKLLFPLMEHGWVPPVHGMLYAGGAFIELIVIVTMQHRIRSHVKPWHMVVFALLMVWITLGPVIGAITEFGPFEAAKQVTSPYEQWRLVKIGDYVEHVDFLSVYQWLAGSTVRVSLSLFLLADIMPFSSQTMRSRFILALTFSYIVLCMFPYSQQDFYNMMYRIYFPASLILGIAYSLLCVGMSFIPEKRRERTT